MRQTRLVIVALSTVQTLAATAGAQTAPSTASSTDAPAMSIGDPVNATPATAVPPSGNADLPGRLPRGINWTGRVSRADALLAAPGTVPVSFQSERPQTIALSTLEGAEDLGAQTPRQYLVDVCTTPCRLFVRPGPLTFRATGPGLRWQRGRVLIPVEGARVRLDARSRNLHIAGVVMFGVGVPTTLVFAALLPLVNSHHPADWISGAALVTGIALAATGVVLWYLNRTPHAVVEPLRRSASLTRFWASPAMIPSGIGAVTGAVF